MQAYAGCASDVAGRYDSASRRIQETRLSAPRETAKWMCHRLIEDPLVRRLHSGHADIMVNMSDVEKAVKNGKVEALEDKAGDLTPVISVGNGEIASKEDREDGQLQRSFTTHQVHVRVPTYEDTCTTKLNRPS